MPERGPQEPVARLVPARPALTAEDEQQPETDRPQPFQDVDQGARLRLLVEAVDDEGDGPDGRITGCRERAAGCGGVTGRRSGPAGCVRATGRRNGPGPGAAQPVVVRQVRAGREGDPAQGVVDEVRRAGAAAVDDVGPVGEVVQRALLAPARGHHGDLHRVLVRLVEPPGHPGLEAPVPGIGPAQLRDVRRQSGDAVDGDQVREGEPVVLGQEGAEVAAPADDEPDHPDRPVLPRPGAHGGAAEALAHHVRLGDRVELDQLTAGAADAPPQAHPLVETVGVAGRVHLHAAPHLGVERGGARLRPRALQAQDGDVLTVVPFRQPAAGHDAGADRGERAVLGELDPQHGVRAAHHVRTGQRRAPVDEHTGTADGAVRVVAPQPESPVLRP
ncbi:hypothetical protein [Streptomyces longwoodensis]|uniref:hypothetical protein n=1 Tax=Streptomyces longwoodensis TaxID=68231 RepID=UPI003F4D4D35